MKYLLHADKTIKSPFVQILMFSGKQGTPAILTRLSESGEKMSCLPQSVFVFLLLVYHSGGDVPVSRQCIRICICIYICICICIYICICICICICISPAGLPLWRRCTGKHTIALWVSEKSLFSVWPESFFSFQIVICQWDFWGIFNLAINAM